MPLPVTPTVTVEPLSINFTVPVLPTPVSPASSPLIVKLTAVAPAEPIVVLASDNMYLYENLEKHVPIAQTLDATSNLRAQDRMKQLAASPRLIVPGHDPAVFEKFPKVSERVVRIE